MQTYFSNKELTSNYKNPCTIWKSFQILFEKYKNSETANDASLFGTLAVCHYIFAKASIYSNHQPSKLILQCDKSDTIMKVIKPINQIFSGTYRSYVSSHILYSLAVLLYLLLISEGKKFFCKLSNDEVYIDLFIANSTYTWKYYYQIKVADYFALKTIGAIDAFIEISKFHEDTAYITTTLTKIKDLFI